MLTRTITLAGSPNVTHTLYFDSRSNAIKAAAPAGGGSNFLTLQDDYGQRLDIHPEAIIISDLTQDGAEMMRAQGEVKIVEVKSQVKLQKRFDEDAELRVMREAAARKDAEAKRNAMKEVLASEEQA